MDPHIPPPPPPAPAPPPTPAPVPESPGGHRYWRDGQVDLQGAAAFAAATADLGQGEGDDSIANEAPLNLEFAQGDLRDVIVRAKKLKDDMYATLIDGSLWHPPAATMMHGPVTTRARLHLAGVWITPFDTLIMDAQDDLKQGIDAISKIADKLVEACDDWEETDWYTGPETDSPVVS